MKKILKIAIFVDSFYPSIDGVVKVVDNLAKKLSERHSVTVFAPASFDKNFKDNFSYKVERCKILKLKFGDYPIAFPLFDKRIKQILKSQKFDIIHLHSPFMVGKLGLRYAEKNNIPCIMTCHSQYQKDFYMSTKSKILTHFLVKGLSKTYNRCNELWTMNLKMKELVRSFGFRGVVKIVPNGCDVLAEGADENYSLRLKKLYASNGEKILLFVGRIYKLKNIDFILKVCRELKKRNYNFKMLIVGGGKLLKKYEKKSKKIGVSDCTVFVGQVDNREQIKCFYDIADLFVFPSAYDSDGLVKSESATFFTPTIFLENTICSAYVEDCVNGYVGKNNEAEFAEKIIQVLGDNEVYAEVCKNANKTLIHPWEEVASIAEKGYEQLIGRYAQNKPNKHKFKKVQKRIKNIKKIAKNS